MQKDRGQNKDVRFLFSLQPKPININGKWRKMVIIILQIVQSDILKLLLLFLCLPLPHLVIYYPHH